jgi:adenylate kinase
MRAVLLGKPGSGKGTQGKRLSLAYNVPVLSTGDMVRKAIASGSALGLEFKNYTDQGLLVPDALVLALVKDALKEVSSQGYLLDGFPRTLEQAQALLDWCEEWSQPLSCVLNIVVPTDILVGRAVGRRSCPADGSVYHIETAKPRLNGRCDVCGGVLVQRSDDTLDVVAKRVGEYENKTAPLVGFYHSRGLLIEVDGVGSLEEVESRIVTALKGLV